MDCTRNNIKKDIIEFFESLGINVNTKTKALGHQGFFRLNRIDISKNIKGERVIPTLIHEFAHYIQFSIKPTCKDFTTLFKNDSDIIYEELIKVTNIVDKNSTLEKLYSQKNNIKQNIIQHEKIIKNKYPDFKRNEKFKPFLKYSRFSNAKYLLKHDAIKVINWFNYKTYSIMNLENEFPDMPDEFVAYLKLKSCQRHQSSITRRINKLTKYYNEPSELFARFIEGIYINKEIVKSIAPNTYRIFKELYYEGYYNPLNQLFEILNIEI